MNIDQINIIKGTDCQKRQAQRVIQLLWLAGKHLKISLLSRKKKSHTKVLIFC